MALVNINTKSWKSLVFSIILYSILHTFHIFIKTCYICLVLPCRRILHLLTFFQLLTNKFRTWNWLVQQYSVNMVGNCRLQEDPLTLPSAFVDFTTLHPFEQIHQHYYFKINYFQDFFDRQSRNSLRSSSSNSSSSSLLLPPADVLEIVSFLMCKSSTSFHRWLQIQHLTQIKIWPWTP